MKKGRYQQSDIDHEPIDKIVFSGKKLCRGCIPLKYHEIHIVTEIHQNKIDDQDGNNA